MGKAPSTASDLNKRERKGVSYLSITAGLIFAFAMRKDIEFFFMTKRNEECRLKHTQSDTRNRLGNGTFPWS
jgi:hypothetical protein